MTTQTIYLIAKTEGTNRVRTIFLPSKGNLDSEFPVGRGIYSSRFSKLMSEYVDVDGKAGKEDGAIVRITIRVHTSSIWIEKCEKPLALEHNAAKVVIDNSLIPTNRALSDSDYSHIKSSALLGKEVNHSFSNAIFDMYQLVNSKFTPKPTIYEAFEAKEDKKEETISVKRNDEYFYVDPTSATLFRMAALSIKETNGVARILMVGESGYGKTSLPKAFAKINEMNVFRMDCAKVRDPEEWFGTRQAVNGSTVFVKSDFIEAVEKGNVVVILDEINRVEPYITNTLFPILENGGTITINNEEVVLGKRIIFVGTINVGFKYSSTFSIDAALLNRFDFVCPVGQIPADQEEKVLLNRTGIPISIAKTIVLIATKIRAIGVVDCSLRTTLSIANSISSNSSIHTMPLEEYNKLIRQAFQFVVINRALIDPGTETRELIDCVNSVVGTFKNEKVSLKVL